MESGNLHFITGLRGHFLLRAKSLHLFIMGINGGTDTVGLFLCDLETEEYRPIYTGLPGQIVIVSTPDFSPDGQWIFFSMGAQIWKIKVNGDSLTQLPFSGRNFYPRWSPDGRKIAFHIAIGDSAGIWVINADGTQRRVGRWGWNFSDWSPDGEHLIFVDWEGNYPVIAEADTTGNSYRILLRARQLDIFQIEGLDYSPDGTKIVFVAFRPGEESMVWVMNADGTDPVDLAVGRDASWTWDG